MRYNVAKLMAKTEQFIKDRTVDLKKAEVLYARDQAATEKWEGKKVAFALQSLDDAGKLEIRFEREYYGSDTFKIHISFKSPKGIPPELLKAPEPKAYGNLQPGCIKMEIDQAKVLYGELECADGPKVSLSGNKNIPTGLEKYIGETVVVTP